MAHSILQMIYYLLERHEPKERGANYFDQLRPVDALKRLTSRLEKLGYKVMLETAQAA